MKVAYQGVPGAFSHEACLAFLPDHQPLGEPTFARVAEAVIYGEADVGMLPLANDSVGPVAEVEEVLATYPLAIVARHKLPIRIHLLALAGTELASLTTAVSHPMALKQCARTLASLGLEAQPASNTAAAAQSLADPAMAVLASEAAASAYGLVIVRRNVHDDVDNATTFAVVARRDR
ncbi:MAG TPA: prephenate dehydratase domain-containing protein [Allosphingosinicella sp.]|jgi:prephenate dehydratase